MSVEDTIFSTLTGLCGGRVYPQVAPAGAAKPYITYQQVAGRPVNFVEAALPGLRNGVFQINCWATSNAAAKALAVDVEEALVLAASIQTTVVGAMVMEYNDVAQLFGSRQDFSLWYTE